MASLTRLTLARQRRRAAAWPPAHPSPEYGSGRVYPASVAGVGVPPLAPGHVEPGEARRWVEATADPDPEAGSAAVVAPRGLVEMLEKLQVGNARAQGWSWRDIARRLGVTTQAVHYKHTLRSRER
jgi:hypothetical protein